MDHGNSGDGTDQLTGMEDPSDPSRHSRAQVRAGNADAFGAIFDVHAKSVYNHAFRLTGDWSVAEDVMSLTFLEAWRTRHRVLPDGGSLRPWLLGIATNLARGHHRAARRHRAAIARIAAHPEMPDFADHVSARLDDAARIAALNRCLSRLHVAELEVLALCAWAELSYTEAAEALDIPVGTVRSRLSRARSKLLRLTEKELEKNSRELPAVTDQEGGESAFVFPFPFPPEKEARR